MVKLCENDRIFAHLVADGFVFEAAELVNFDLESNVFDYCLIKVVLQCPLQRKLAKEGSL